MPMNRNPELDIPSLLAAYEARVVAACPQELPLALLLRERLQPERWMLEWHLPWWLGGAFGLDSETCRELVLSNVLGLGSIRLQDDLLDGEVADEAVDSARTLAAALYEVALDFYRRRFPPSSPVWTQLEMRMAEWQSSIPAEAAAGQAEMLARRAAPLKISAFAVCELAGRVDRFRVLDSLLDHALAALVRCDDFYDWQHDLAAGRWNGFIASVSSRPQVPEYMQANRSSVFAAMMAGDAVAAHFTLIRRDLERAIVLGDELGVPALVTHLTEFGALLERQGAMLETHYRSVAEQAAFLLFGGYESEQHIVASI
jgi:hypothetical protein